MLRTIERFFVSWRFAVFTICLLLGCVAWVALLLWMPRGPTGLGAFADDFRRWCFGEGTGPNDGSAFMVFATFFELISMAAVIGFIWWKPVRQQLAVSARPFVPYALAAGGLAVSMVLGLFLLRPDPAAFPERELRTALPAPRLQLTSQDGQPVSLEALKGKVVVVTAVYATCGLACPRILGQAKRVVAGLTAEERNELVVLGITLDPDHDDLKALSAMAQAQNVKPPLYHLLSGAPPAVNAALDAFGVMRKRDPKTQIIDHVNLFVLIDRQGKIAYRFTLGELQEKWMGLGLRALLREPIVPLTAARD